MPDPLKNQNCLSIWVDKRNLLMFVFYEKPMGANQVIQRDSALAEDTKINSLTYAKKMTNSGYVKCQVSDNSWPKRL